MYVLYIYIHNSIIQYVALYDNNIVFVGITKREKCYFSERF